MCLVFGYYAFVHGIRVPLLGGVDLGFHEFGHFATYVFPEAVTAAMGSIAQILAPLLIAAYFLIFRRDVLGGALCLAWAGTSAQDVSVYIADAPFENLPLIGGEHDWATVLGPDHLNMLGSAHTIASIVKGLGLLLFLAGLALCIAGPFIERRRIREAYREEQRAAGGGGFAISPPWETGAGPQQPN